MTWWILQDDWCHMRHGKKTFIVRKKSSVIKRRSELWKVECCRAAGSYPELINSLTNGWRVELLAVYKEVNCSESHQEFSSLRCLLLDWFCFWKHILGETRGLGVGGARIEYPGAGFRLRSKNVRQKAFKQDPWFFSSGNAPLMMAVKCHV